MKFYYHYFPERHEWLGAVIDNGAVLTVASEATEEDILAWWDKFQTTGDETDMYDRATKQ